jgi:hypothetical protein
MSDRGLAPAEVEDVLVKLVSCQLGNGAAV